MTMKQKFIIKHQIFLLGAALLAVSCSETTIDTEPTVSKAKAGAGREVLFSMGTSSLTRTVYGDADENGFNINWVDLDSITIHSKEALVGIPIENEGDTPKTIDQDFAHYVVNTVEDDPTHSSVTPIYDQQRMLWKDSETDHTFYAVYPKCRNLSMNAGTFSMRYHTNQECTGLTLDKKGNYSTSPDMRNLYMMAKNTAKAPDVGHVLINFDPIMTTLDITITAGRYEVGTGIIQPITVTGVSVIMPKYLDGEFKYDMLTGGDTADTHDDSWGIDNSTVKDGTETVFVSVVDDRDGTEKHSLDMFEGETLNLMAFLPPMDVDQYKIRVHTTAGFDFIKTVRASDLGGSMISKRSRISITLPNIYPDGVDAMGLGDTQAMGSNNWISQLDGSTPIKKLSIPGHETNKDTNAEEIKKMLDHGVRAFDLDAFNGHTDATNSVPSAFFDTFNSWIKENPNEFVMVWVEKTIAVRWNHDQRNWLTTLPKTIEEARGKVIALIRIQSNKHFKDSNSFTDNNLFSASNLDTSKSLLSNSWGCYYLDGDNMVFFNKLFEKRYCNEADGDDLELHQTGFTGIAMVPFASHPFNNGAYTNSDLLIQGIIDCNYKFNFRKDSSK